jgi:ferredoxin
MKQQAFGDGFRPRTLALVCRLGAPRAGPRRGASANDAARLAGTATTRPRDRRAGRPLCSWNIHGEEGHLWRVTVDDDCAGSGMCAGIAPRHFRTDDGDRFQPVTAEMEPDDSVLDAAASCPMEAIRITDLGIR